MGCSAHVQPESSQSAHDDSVIAPQGGQAQGCGHPDCWSAYATTVVVDANPRTITFGHLTSSTAVRRLAGTVAAVIAGWLVRMLFADPAFFPAAWAPRHPSIVARKRNESASVPDDQLRRMRRILRPVVRSQTVDADVIWLLTIL
jgi:hypothetical protein